MKMKTDINNFNVNTIHELMIKSQQKRDMHPVDYNCMHLSYCKEHPVDLLFEEIEEAANMGLDSCYFYSINLFRNLTDDTMKEDLVEKGTKTVGKWFWKKEVEYTYTVNRSEHFRNILVRDIMDELSRVLWNLGFKVERGTSCSNDITGYFIISW